MIIQLEGKLEKSEAYNNKLKNENEHLKKTINQDQVEKENFESIINSLQRKNRSLAQELEKGHSEKSSGSNIWNFSLSPILTKLQKSNDNDKSSTVNKDEVSHLKEELKKYEEEFKNLRQKNLQLGLTIETYS